MSGRGWKYRCYADEPETPVADFICGVLGGAIGFFNFPGWLLVYFDVLSMATLLLLCLGAGLIFGGWLAYENIKESHTALEKSRAGDD